MGYFLYETGGTLVTELEQVETWRAYVATEHGCTDEDAARFAAAHHANLHELVDLIDGGCDPALAVQILV